MVAWSNIVQVLGIRHGLQARDYALTDDYSLATFFDNFDFFSSHDPTNGFVRYQTGEAATSAGLILTKPDAAEVHVDARDVAPAGRGGVRLESKRSYDSGLVIIDVKHMPGGICGVWPALWMLGPEWPTK